MLHSESQQLEFQDFVGSGNLIGLPIHEGQQEAYIYRLFLV
jgi:hypothetical protein